MRSWPSRDGSADVPSTRSSTCTTLLPSPPHVTSWRRGGKKGRAEPERYELHFQDETHRETNAYLCRVWPRRGKQAKVPAAGTNRRVTVFGSVEALGRGRIELVRAAQDSAGFMRYLDLLDTPHQAVQRAIYLVLDNGSAHTSTASLRALLARSKWLHVIWLAIWLAKYSPHLTPKGRERRYWKRDARRHLAATRRTFVDGILTGLRQLGGTLCTMVDEVPQWFLDGHRKPPTGRPPARPVGSQDSCKRAPYHRKQNLAADT